MKQPIAGLKGIKPRLEKPNGKLSREEAHKLDREYQDSPQSSSAIAKPPRGNAACQVTGRAHREKAGDVAGGLPADRFSVACAGGTFQSSATAGRRRIRCGTAPDRGPGNDQARPLRDVKRLGQFAEPDFRSELGSED